MFSFKDAIKKIQEYYPGFEEKELTNIDEWYDKEENQEYYKTNFPKSYEAIMKNLSSVWWKPAELDKEQDFDKFCKQYHYYNCNLFETGKQIAFYKKEN